MSAYASWQCKDCGAAIGWIGNIVFRGLLHKWQGLCKLALADDQNVRPRWDHQARSKYERAYNEMEEISDAEAARRLQCVAEWPDSFTHAERWLILYTAARKLYRKC